MKKNTLRGVFFSYECLRHVIWRLDRRDMFAYANVKEDFRSDGDPNFIRNKKPPQGLEIAEIA